MSTWKLIGIWFLVFLGELIIVMVAMELWHIPWISILVLIGMMAYNIPRRYRTIRGKNTLSQWDAYLPVAQPMNLVVPTPL